MASTASQSTTRSDGLSAPIASTDVIYLNVGGQRFITLRSTLTAHSIYFEALLSGRWDHQMHGDLFVDADPALFGHILNYLRRGFPPVFWTRTNGFDLALYTALQREAEYFGVTALEKWIVKKQYLHCISSKLSIEVVNLSDCLNDNVPSFFSDTEKRLDPTEYTTTGGIRRKRVQVWTTEYVAPENLWTDPES